MFCKCVGFIVIQDDEDDEDDGDDEDGDDDRDDEDDEDEVDDNDDDVDDSEGSSGLLTSKSARDHVFPILIAELVKEGLIGKREGSFIMDQFNSGNPIIRSPLLLFNMLLNQIRYFMYHNQCCSGCVRFEQ